MLTIVIPLSGEGKTFIDRGFTFPKPLVEVSGRPMIDIVVANLKLSEPHRFVFICRRDHLLKYALDDVLHLIAPDSSVVSIGGETAGALCSVICGSDFISPEDELIIANGDQFIDRSLDDFVELARTEDADGALVVFPSTHPKWSYAKTDADGLVVAVAEKRPISRNATAGIYYFRRGREFIDAATRTLLKGSSVRGEFYVCPVYNELILDGRKVVLFQLLRSEMHSLGTPEDLDVFSIHAATLSLHDGG